MLHRRQPKTLMFIIIILQLSAIPNSTATIEHIKSQWLRHPVTPDGAVTSDAEWSDTNRYEILLGLNTGKSPPYLRTWIWAKNDNTSLYILLKIEHFKSLQYDIEDQAFIYYLWSASVASSWDSSDAAWAYQLGSPSDMCNLSGATWTHDTVASGSNDVTGSGYYDSMFYWFEIVKALNSTDGCDWTLKPGDTVGAGNPTQTSDLLYVGLYDDSSGKKIENRITLTLSAPQKEASRPVGGSLEPNTPNLQGPTILILLITLGSLFSYKHHQR